MGKTETGHSAPYCPRCEKHTLRIKDDFGTPCPVCKTKTVWYHDYTTRFKSYDKGRVRE